MIKTLGLVLAILPSRADSVEHYYSLGDVDALQALCAEPLSREEDLMCRYRLYPLTTDRDLISEIPTALDDGSARENAMLAGLWGYRASSGSLFNMIRCGRRASRLISAARELDPEEPFVLLIEGQSFLFRPGMFGGDSGRALQLFRQLQRVTGRHQSAGISTLEADLWVWLALKRLGDPAADAVRESIESRSPPPMYRDFLENPPS